VVYIANRVGFGPVKSNKKGEKTGIKKKKKRKKR